MLILDAMVDFRIVLPRTYILATFCRQALPIFELNIRTRVSFQNNHHYNPLLDCFNYNYVQYHKSNNASN